MQRYKTYLLNLNAIKLQTKLLVENCFIPEHNFCKSFASVVIFKQKTLLTH